MDAQAAEAMRRATVLSGTLSVTTGTLAGIGNPFAVAAIPARYALERQDWAGAARLDVIATPDTPHVEAMTHFARALGASRSGNPAAAQEEIAKLAALRDRAMQLKDPYWSGMIEIQRQGAEAWKLTSEGQREAGIRLMKAAADAEDATEKAAVTPGPLAPSREMLGFMLLEAGMLPNALEAFQAAALHEPNRFLALYGAAQTADRLGDHVTAQKLYGRIVEMCRDTAPGRAELAFARKQLSRK
jgi:tetratricopeptide (TPR) repeat protein